MGIRSQVTSVRTNDGNCECFLLEGGGEEGWDIQWKLEWHGIAWYWWDLKLLGMQKEPHSSSQGKFFSFLKGG